MVFKNVLLLSLFAITFFFNSDLSIDRFVLFMDEQIIFDETLKIISAQGLEGVLHAMVNGDQRYGRVLYYYTALTGKIPYEIFGETGLIIAIRASMVMLILLSIYVGTRGIKSFRISLLSILVMFIMPYSIYYQSMPKPEPLLLFLIILFLDRFCCQKKSPWFLLGFILGTKISSLPFVLFYLSCLIWVNRVNAVKLFKGVVKFVFAFFMSVPILFAGKWSQYFENTILNSGHGADDSKVNLLSWINFSANELGVLWYLLMLSVAGYFLYIGSKNLKHLTKMNKAWVHYFIASLSFYLPIVLFVKRLWGFYLFISAFLMLLALVNLSKDIDWRKLETKFGLDSVLSVVLIFIVIGWAPNYFTQYKQLSMRTQSAEYKSKLGMMNKMESLWSSILESKLSVIHIDPNFFYKNSAKINYVPFYGPYAGWMADPDAIVLKSTHCTEKTGVLPLESNLEYTKCLEGRMLQEKYTESSEALFTKVSQFDQMTIYVNKKNMHLSK